MDGHPKNLILIQMNFANTETSIGSCQPLLKYWSSLFPRGQMASDPHPDSSLDLRVPQASTLRPGTAGTPPSHRLLPINGMSSSFRSERLFS